MATESQASAKVFVAPEGKRAIPSLDGLRAVSVIMVLLGHSETARLERLPLNYDFRQGQLGVNVFFLISGFLITHLLLKEMNRTGSIHLGRFYFRRSFRIFPPFYAFLAVVALLHAPDVTTLRLVEAGTYTWNYLASGNCWILGHTWSLAVEEQFYLIWPLIMFFCGRKRSLWVAIIAIYVSPIVRVATYVAFPSMRGAIPIMLHTHLDPIMAGCALSIIVEQKMWQRFLHRLMHPAFAALSALFLLFVNSPLEIRFRGSYWLTVGETVQSVAIGSILLFVVFKPHSWPGRLLNLPPVRHIGMISYSLYLWQQVFTGHRTESFPLNLLWIFVCAELSYALVEKTSFYVRDRLDLKIFPKLQRRAAASA